MHLNITAGAVFGALVAALAEFQLECIGLPGQERFDDSAVLTIAPALPAFEAHAATHTTPGFIDELFLGQSFGNLGLERFEPLGGRKLLSLMTQFLLIIREQHLVRFNRFVINVIIDIDLLARDLLMNLIGRDPALINRDRHQTQFKHITAGINTLDFGLVVIIGLDPVPALAQILEALEFGLLADGRDKAGCRLINRT